MNIQQKTFIEYAHKASNYEQYKARMRIYARIITSKPSSNILEPSPNFAWTIEHPEDPVSASIVRAARLQQAAPRAVPPTCAARPTSVL